MFRLSGIGIGMRRLRAGRNVAHCVALVSCLLAATASAGKPVRILVLGDSLTSGYGLPAGQAFPPRLERALAAKGHAVELINAGVAGDTTAGGLARLDWALGDDPNIVIVALGGNDGLRGLDPASTYDNLTGILSRLGAKDIPVLLIGMLAPPNLGADYGAAFNAVFPRLAKKHRVALYPFFLDGVATRPALNQADGIHPNARGVEVMVDRIAPHVVRLLDASK